MAGRFNAGKLWASVPRAVFGRSAAEDVHWTAGKARRGGERPALPVERPAVGRAWRAASMRQAHLVLRPCAPDISDMAALGRGWIGKRDCVMPAFRLSAGILL